MSTEEIVERIPDTDSRGKKWFFFLFFMLLPLTGVLLFWFDGHAKIEKEAVTFVQTTAIPAIEKKGEQDMMDLATPELADKLRDGDYAWVEQDLGELKSYTRLDADQTRAREENDHGVIYAEVDFTGKFEKGSARVHMLITRLSLSNDWSIKELEIVKKK